MDTSDSFLQIFATVIFFIAVLHFFLSDHFLRAAHRIKQGAGYTGYSLLGNAALIFGLWMIPILVAMAWREGPTYSARFLESTDFKEPFAYFVLVAIATVRPLRNLFDSIMTRLCHVFKKRVLFFWMGTILLSSLLTGIFSEIAIMTLVCLYFSKTFFSLKPSRFLSYLTFSFLLLAIAVGTSILPFNFSFFMDVLNGDWSHWQIFFLFGWKVFLGLVGLLFVVGLMFKEEFNKLQSAFSKQLAKPHPIRFREVLYAALFLLASIGKDNVYILLLVLGIVIILHKYPYRQKEEEGAFKLYFPLLIAFFTYSLELHAQLQTWWVLPLFEQVEGVATYGYAFFLTGLNEHVPLQALKVSFAKTSEQTKFFSYLGVLTGGGLTMIAKSANVVSKLTLRQHFPHRAISPLFQLLIALPLGLLLAGFVTLLTYLGR